MLRHKLFYSCYKSVSSLQGDLRIGVTFHLLNAILYAIIGSFSKGNFYVKLHTDSLGLWYVLKALQEDAIDVGLIGFWFKAQRATARLMVSASRPKKPT